MKKNRSFDLAFLLVTVLFVQESFAQTILEGHSDPGNSKVFSSTGNILSTGSLDGDYRTWRLPEGAIMRLGKGAIGRGDRALGYSPDGTRLAVASTIGIWLYDVRTGAEVNLLPGGSVTSVAFSTDGALLASGALDNTVQLWDMPTNTNIARLEGHSDGVRAVAFSHDGKMLASGAGDPTVHFPADNTIKLWDVATNAIIATLEGHKGMVASVAFSPDGKILVSGSNDETVKLWDVATKESIATLEGHTDGVASVAFSPDGTILASGARTFDETVKLWDVATKESIATLEGHTDGVASVAFSPDGTILAAGVGDAFFSIFFLELSENTVKLWDVTSGDLIISPEGRTETVHSVAFSPPDGKTIVAGARMLSDYTVRLWDVASGNQTASLEGHTQVVHSVAYLSDGRRLASGSGNTIMLWDAASGDQMTSLEGFVLSPDGTRRATLSWDGAILLWDVASGDRIASLEGHEGDILSAFSPDGKVLATGSGFSSGYTVRLWDAAGGELIATLEGFEGRVASVAFSTDGKLLASGGGYFDSTVKVVGHGGKCEYRQP